MDIDFSQIDIDGFSVDDLRRLVDISEWETPDSSGNHSSPGSYTQEVQNYTHYPSQEPNYMGSPVSTNYELNAGYPPQAYTNNPSAITPRPQPEGYVQCCGKSWKLGSKYTKHYNRCHNRRFKCAFYEDCQYGAGEVKDLHRHYWVYHEAYAKENNIPSPRAECPACGQPFGRKDRVRRHLSRFPSCRKKLALNEKS
ncbi:Ff.00g068310.m01.CDS01 [Fusarium sp. VM40]|nr:Ff.00g068310.m01.CDS01 [Fusarium sp. VM40]